MADRPAGLVRARLAYQRRFGKPPRWLGWGPGRINVIGEHTDYNLGLAMPAAIDRWVVVAMDWREDRSIELRSEDFDEAFELPLGQPVASNAPTWVRIAMGCVAELSAVHPIDRGLQAVVAGDVPLGAGLSSSAAVEMAWLNALRAATGAAIDDLGLVRLGQRVENVHLGLASGLLDQVASQLSRPDQLMVVDFEDLRVRWTPAALEGWSWVVVDSGVRRELAGSAYRDRVAECARGLEVARGFDPDLRGFRDLRPWHLQVLAQAGHRLSALRLGHLLAENDRVRAMERALNAGDGPGAGDLLLASHRSLRDAYQVSCAELDLLVELALAWRGCVGARMVGGGFGGCTLNLLRASRVPGFAEYLAQAYRARSGIEPRVWRFRLVGGAGSSDLEA